MQMSQQKYDERRAEALDQFDRQQAQERAKFEAAWEKLRRDVPKPKPSPVVLGSTLLGGQ